ncbi:MAG: di-trans,poly-cis-decaprenylcistransferase [Hyphomicrobiales bacterium]|nr:isoprenyl transferase [Hyphomicrobiales bacterium]PCJ89805.1 MAG: di-trans,poly-cis-decaprenylcistransferase [Hyphomicrobiales bacterium]
MNDAQFEDALPQHVAIIMDGNGRWAQQRGLPRLLGHKAGVGALRNVIDYSIRVGLKNLTLFSFSSENWSRPQSEVDALMNLMRRYVKSDLAELNANNVRVNIIGARDDLQQDIRSYLTEAEDATANNTGLNLSVAFNYGSKNEICRAVKKVAEKVALGELSPSEINEDVLDGFMDTAGMVPPDLLIRTSGEHRLSNFLLWQIAYTELYFTDVFWPDFNEAEFEAALNSYTNRNRRFGGLHEARSAV